jgi:hypothetical protein
MIIDERADQGRMRLSHRLRDFLGIVPEDELDDPPLADTPAASPARGPDSSPAPEPVVVTEMPAECEPVAAREPEPAPTQPRGKRRPVAGPQTAAERADLRDIIAELRDALDESS